LSYIDSAPSTEPTSKTDTDKKPSGRLRKYWREIEAYNKAAQDWQTQSDTITKLYLDQHRTHASPRRFALLWSNIETLKPAVYAKAPNILCSRRHKDPDPIGRVAAEILERATNTALDLGKADERFRMVRDDRLLTSRGQGWVRYEANLDGDKIISEKAPIDYVNYRDFGHNVCGTWADVWLVWRKVYKDRAEVRKRFDVKGKKVSDKLTYSAKTASDDDKEMGEHKACLIEIWDKKEGKVCFISKDCPDILEDGPPPIDFRDFFPCPEPCYGTKTSKSLFPTPDYRYYQDQAQEIDDLTQQIAGLTDMLVPRGFVPTGPSADGADAVRILIQNLQSQLTQNKTIFIPVEAWASFSEKGGAKGLIEWMPVEEFVNTLKGAIEARNQLVQDVYQITGIADILRGQTDPDETLGAQQLKAQTGARRVKNAKDEVARFCRDISQLVAEVIAEQFQPQTLADMSGFAYMPAPPVQPGMEGMAPPPQSPSGKTFDDSVLELLRNDRMRGFLIDIETDSTIQPDEDAEKQRRTEFLTAMGGFLQQSGEMMQVAPSLFPLVTEMALFGVRGYRVGRQMEDIIETTLKNVAQELQQRQQQPDPKVQAEQQKMQQQMQIEQAKAEMQMQLEQMKLQHEQQRLQMEQAHEQQRMEMELQFKQAELQLKEQEAASKMQIEQVKAEQKMQLDQQKMQQDAQLAEQEAKQKAELEAQEAQVRQASMMQEAEIERKKFEQETSQGQEAHATKIKQSDEQHKQKLKLDEAAAKQKAANEAEAEKATRAEREREAKERRAELAKKKRTVTIKSRGADKKPTAYEISYT
jgi:hypothetical protein